MLHCKVCTICNVALEVFCALGARARWRTGHGGEREQGRGGRNSIRFYVMVGQVGLRMGAAARRISRARRLGARKVVFY